MNVRQKLIQANMENYWKLASNTSYIKFEANDNCVKTVSTMPDALLNSVLSVQPGDNDSEKVVDDLENYYSQRGLSFCCWVFPDQHSASLSAQLEAHQFNYDGVIEGMALTKLDQINLDMKIPAGITIKSVKSNFEFDDWIKPITTSFGLSETGSNGYKSIYKDLFTKNDDVEHYVAYRGSDPVSSCSLFLDKESNTAGIYNCGTVPDARKLGICTALTKHVLFNAQQKGYKTSVLQATHFSKGLFEEIGFESCTSYKLYYK